MTFQIVLDVERVWKLPLFFVWLYYAGRLNLNTDFKYADVPTMALWYNTHEQYRPD